MSDIERPIDLSKNNALESGSKIIIGESFSGAAGSIGVPGEANVPLVPAAPAHGRKAAANAVYLIGAFGLMQVIRFGANILFARVLQPEAFGIMVLVNVLIQGLHMLSDAGVWICVVQSSRGEDPKFLQTAWTVQVVRGLYLWLASFVIAWPAARFYQEWQLLYFVPIVGVTSLISGFNSVSMFLQNRRLALFRLAAIEVMAYAIPTGVALIIIQYQPTVWVLVFSALGSSLVQFASSHLLLPPSQHRFRWDPESVKELLGFGRWVFVSTFFTFLATQADRLIVGAATSVAKLGIYNIAAMFASAPTVMLSTLANNLMIPYYSRLRHTSPNALALMSRAHTLAGILAWSMAALLVVASQDVIDLLYRGPYEEAGLMAPVIAIVAWFQMLQALGGAILFAHGKVQLSALINVLKLLALVVFVPIGLHLGGLEGLLWAFAVAEFTRYTSTVYVVRRVGMHLWRSDLILTMLLGLVFAASALDLLSRVAPVECLRRLLSDHAAWTRTHDRDKHISRLLLETFSVGMASSLVLA
ncbi:MAG TPA: oligosaccharide flippase family protein, partial [Gemmataceae bacterium]|nr:oligosaccharide flippase family protein [Gemmataceae bacterium]